MTKSIPISQATNRNSINTHALIPAVQSLRNALSCVACHLVVLDNEFQVHVSCGGGGRYCPSCRHKLSHCLTCDEPLTTTATVEKILCTRDDSSSSPSPGKLLSLLENILDNRSQGSTYKDDVSGFVSQRHRHSIPMSPEQPLRVAQLQSGTSSASHQKKRRFQEIGNIVLKQTTKVKHKQQNAWKQSKQRHPCAIDSPKLQSTQPYDHDEEQRLRNHALAQSDNEPLSEAETMSFSLPSTCDLAGRLEVGDVSGFCNHKNSDDITSTLPPNTGTSRNSLPSTFDFPHERRITGSKHPLPTQESTTPTSTIDVLPETQELIRKLSEATRNDSIEATERIVVAVETIPEDKAEMFRRLENQIHFVPRICRSTIDLDDSVVLPSHFLTTSFSEDQVTRVCRRTFEYLKAMALGLCIVDTAWIEDRDDSKRRIWGDSQLAKQTAAVTMRSTSNPYCWLTSSDWWGTNHGPCWSASRSAEKCHHLLNGFVVQVLQSDAIQDTTPLLEGDELELLCVLAGADSVVSLGEDRSFFQEEQRILLVPDDYSHESITQLMESSKTALPHGATFDSMASGESRPSAIVVKESWLLDSICAHVVAPLTIYSVGILHW